MSGARRRNRRAGPPAGPRARTVLAGLLLLAAGEAHAHAVHLGAEPPKGSLLEEPPEILLLHFTEPVAPLRTELLDHAGKPPPVEIEARREGATLEVHPIRPLAAGGYLLAWRVRSLDDHPIGGGLPFVVGNGALPLGPSVSVLPAMAATTARAPHIGVVLLAWGASAWNWLLPVGPRTKAAVARVARGAALAALAASLGRLGLAGAAALDLPSLGWLDPATWSMAASGRRGPAVLVSGAGLALLLVSAGRPTRRHAALAGLVLPPVGLALTGHSGFAGDTPAAGLALAAHIALADLWIGGLWPLGHVLAGERAAAAEALERFGRIALLAVPLLLALGGLLATLHLPTPRLPATGWGRLLLAKLALVAGLLLIGALNRLCLVPRLRAGAPVGAILAGLLGLDGLLAACVVAVTALLASSPPPRAEAVATGIGDAGPWVPLEGPDCTLRLRLLPGRAGPNRLEPELLDRGRREPPLELWVAFALPGAGIEGIAPPGGSVVPDASASGPVELGQVVPVPAGAWRASVIVLVDTFTARRCEAGVQIGPGRAAR